MFYQIRSDVLFRKGDGFGFITDNSEYGYRLMQDHRPQRKELFVSEVGAVMLSTLKKIPTNIDDCILELHKLFQDVDVAILKQDTIEFFDDLVRKGYLSFGLTEQECLNNDITSNFFNSNIECTPTTDSNSATQINSTDFLRTIHFDIARVCNEKCVHCYLPHGNNVRFIEPDLFHRILIEGRNMNIIHVTLSGGEPLLHKHLLQFLKWCYELDLSVNVLSNLTLLNDEIVDEMRKNPLLSVQTSIYSMDPLVHDSITQHRGSLEKTINGLMKLADAGIPTQISCPVMKQNKDSIEDVIAWGHNRGNMVAIEPVIFGSFDKSNNNLINRLSLQEIDGVLDTMLRHGYANDFSEHASEIEQLPDDSPVCSICRYSLCVSVDGKAFPCAGWQSNIIGDLQKQSLHEIWHHSEKIKQLRSIKRSHFSQCLTCQNRGYCTICMMSNANENSDGDAFKICNFKCQVAALKRNKVINFLELK